jgi:ubiquinone biosynthesis protein
MLKTAHLGRYRDLALLLTRYGLKDFTVRLDPSEPMIDEPDDRPMEPDVHARAVAFAERLKAMGPTFIKFGQLLSTRPDLVPPEYVVALEELQDQVEPFPFAEVEKIVESELGVRISKAFTELEAVPIAAASLGQVHRAVLRDGREVVVKVQRPNIRETIQKDLEVFAEIAGALEQHTAIGRKMNLVGTVDQLRRTLLDELDYLKELQHGNVLRRNLAEFEEIYVPIAIPDLSTSKVLTTELVEGKKVSRLSGVALTENNYAPLAKVVTQAYLKQICVDGIWHSDPHPGNVFLRDGQLVLLDFGMVSRMASDLQDDVVKLLLGSTQNRGKDVAEVCIKLGRAQAGFDRKRFEHDVSTMVTAYHDVDLKRANAGQMIFQLISLANAHELQIPSELAMLAKTLLHLDHVTRLLDPEFNARETIEEYAEQLIVKMVRQRLAPRNYYGTLLDLNELAIEFPIRSRQILDRLANGKMAVRIELDEADYLLKGMQRIANRIAVGAMIAALLISSAIIMRTHSALALIGYIVAAAMALYLVITILMTDRQDRQKVRDKKQE